MKKINLIILMFFSITLSFAQVVEINKVDTNTFTINKDGEQTTRPRKFLAVKSSDNTISAEVIDGKNSNVLFTDVNFNQITVDGKYGEDADKTVKMLNKVIYSNDRLGLSLKLGLNMVDSSGGWDPFVFLSRPDEMAFSRPFELGAEYRFSDLLAVGADVSINKWKENKGIIDNLTVIEDIDYFAVDLKVKLFLDDALGIFNDWDWLDLYVDAGAGYFTVDNGTASDAAGLPDDGNISFNAGIGANFWLSDSWAIYVDGTSKFRNRFETPDTNHFQYAVGAMYNFRDKDTDNDGLNDKNDECPYVYGPRSNNGCPEEKQPDLSAIDTDGDGVTDDKDNCPTVKGLITNYGCPDGDSDGDGVLDSVDVCPKVPGTMSNGCPNNDFDSDGIINEFDKCPQVYGLTSNDGCPKEEVDLNVLISNVYFDYNSYKIKTSYFQTLIQNAKVLNDNTDRNFIITGHTDNRGSEAYNTNLSEQRANAVKSFLMHNGVPSEILTIQYKGYEEPASTNDTQQGKALNRRVEIKVNGNSSLKAKN